MDGEAWRQMRRPTLVRATDGALLVPRLALAVNSWRRMRGLLGRAGLAEEEGMLFVPCNNIHMFFMRFCIDVVFVSHDWRTLKICANIRPWRLAVCWDAAAAVELPAGRAQRMGWQVGDRMEVVAGADDALARQAAGSTDVTTAAARGRDRTGGEG